MKLSGKTKTLENFEQRDYQVLFVLCSRVVLAATLSWTVGGESGDRNVALLDEREHWLGPQLRVEVVQLGPGTACRQMDVICSWIGCRICENKSSG